MNAICGGSPAELLPAVEALSGQNLAACYQCGTCSAGCPFAASMDLLPEQLLRRVLFGLDGVLESRAIWLCVSCYACVERCPRGIDMAKIMEALRHIRLRQVGDQLNLSQLNEESLADLPPIALVASIRKNTG